MENVSTLTKNMLDTLKYKDGERQQVCTRGVQCRRKNKWCQQSSQVQTNVELHKWVG